MLRSLIWDLSSLYYRPLMLWIFPKYIPQILIYFHFHSVQILPDFSLHFLFDLISWKYIIWKYLVREHTLCDLNSFNCVVLWQECGPSWEIALCTREECAFCCWVEHSINSNKIIWLIELFKPIVPLLIFCLLLSLITEGGH